MPPLIYHGAPTRSCRLVMLFEELSAPYEIKLVDALKGEHRKYGPGKLQPAVGSKDRAAFLYGTFSPAIVSFVQHSLLLPEESRVPTIAESAKARSLHCCDLLEKKLAGSSFSVGSELSAVDIMMIFGLFLTFGFVKIADATSHPKLHALFERLRSRDSYKKAFGPLA